MALATPALAVTTLSLSPPNIAVVQGQSFNIIIGVNPQGIKNYTAKIKLQYPAELLEAKLFTFGNGWMALSQPGYDSINNVKGILIKTAGYPGGISKSVIFGTVSFSTKKTGKGIIKIGADSIVLDGASHNVFKDTAVQNSLTIRASTSFPEEVLPPEEAPEEEIASSPPAIFDILTQPETKQSQRKLLIPIFASVGTLMLVIVGYVIYRKRKRKIV